MLIFLLLRILGVTMLNHDTLSLFSLPCISRKGLVDGHTCNPCHLFQNVKDVPLKCVVYFLFFLLPLTSYPSYFDQIINNDLFTSKLSFPLAGGNISEFFSLVTKSQFGHRAKCYVITCSLSIALLRFDRDTVFI